MNDVDMTIESANWMCGQAREAIEQVRGQKLRVDQVYKLVELRGRLAVARRDCERVLQEGGYTNA